MKHRKLILAGVCAVGLTAFEAAALPLNPNDFASLGQLNGAAITIDTDALTFNGGAGGTLFSQGGAPFGERTGGPPDIAVFAFDGGSVLGDVTVTGANAVAFLFLGDVTVSGAIDIGGQTTNAANPGVTSGGDAGPGGGQGRRGFRGLSNPREQDGFGPGGGEHGSVDNGGSNDSGGAGGGFGTPGGDAGAGIGGVDGGVVHGDLAAALQGGSGGGGGGGFQGAFFGGGSGGGGGGGALEIGALGALSFVGAEISADGADGNFLPGRVTGGGGGSGGGLFFHAFDIVIDLDTVLTANGGDGGGAGGGRGGCGGGGRITFLSNTDGSLTNNGQIEANPGAAGGACDPLTTNISFLTAPDIGDPPTQSPPVAQIPEPATAPLLALALALLAWRGRRQPPTT